MNNQEQNFRNYSLQHVHFYSDEISNQLMELLSSLKEGYTMADLGCGDGALLFALDRNGHINKAGRVIGVDISEDRIKNLSLVSSKIEGICSDVLDTAKYIKNQTVDLVVSTQVIEHVNDDTKFLSEVNRILKPDGKFHIDTVFKKFYGIYFYRNNNGFVIDPTHVREYTNLKEIKKKFFDAGLEITNIRIFQVYFPISDLTIRLLISINLIKPHKVREIYIKNRILNFIRKYLKIPIIGYKFIEITGQKNSYRSQALSETTNNEH